jgi:large subunit ribosomal protein L35
VARAASGRETGGDNKWWWAPKSPWIAERLPASKKERTAQMPKMKTKKSAAKRFEIRASGSIKRGQAHKRHILTKKTTKAKRHLRGPVTLHEADVKSVRRMMPYA